jgi:hypothetical protein
MRAAALVVVLLGSACASDDPISDPNSTGDEVIDLADFRELEPTASGLVLPPGCGALTASAVQRFANENLRCGGCYQVLCDGAAFAHVCAEECDGANAPDDDTTVPISMK